MTSPARPIPASLAKRGITGVTHNLQPGQEVNFVKPLFWAFREELEARFLKPVPKAAHPVPESQG
jgi:hypothetical protein